MPIYEYVCKQEKCRYQFEISRSIKDHFLTKCPECLGETLTLVFHAVPALIKCDPKTVATLAGRNSDRLGYKAIQEKHEESQERKELAKAVAREQLEAKLPKGASLPNTTKGNESPIDMKLANLNKQQKEKYIVEGKLE